MGYSTLTHISKKRLYVPGLRMDITQTAHTNVRADGHLRYLLLTAKSPSMSNRFTTQAACELFTTLAAIWPQDYLSKASKVS
jgi:hypothetical protein